MLKVYQASNKNHIDTFINAFMNNAPGWVISQPDAGKMRFPADFVVISEPQIKHATIQVLQY